MRYVAYTRFVFCVLCMFMFSGFVYAAGQKNTPIVVAQQVKEKSKVTKKKSGKEKSKAVGKAKSKEKKATIAKKPPEKSGPSKMPIYFAIFSALLGTGAVLGAAFFTNPPAGTQSMSDNSFGDQFGEDNRSEAA